MLREAVLGAWVERSTQLAVALLRRPVQATQALGRMLLHLDAAVEATRALGRMLLRLDAAVELALGRMLLQLDAAVEQRLSAARV